VIVKEFCRRTPSISLIVFAMNSAEVRDHHDEALFHEQCPHVTRDHVLYQSVFADDPWRLSKCMLNSQHILFCRSHRLKTSLIYDVDVPAGWRQFAWGINNII
jgi:hypothetical protein